METTIGEIAMQDNNVITLNTTAQQEARIALIDSSYDGSDFPVKYSSLYIEDGTCVTNKYASVNDTTGQILGIHSRSYKPLTHKEMVDTQRGIIVRSGMADSSIKETIVLDNTSKKCFVTHEMPNQSFLDPTGDLNNLRLTSINSFCGTWAYQIMAGAIRPPCLNGQVFTNGSAAIYKSRHNRHLDTDHAADVITKAIPIFMEQVELWHQWHGTDITDYKAALIFAETLSNPTIIDTLYSTQGFSLDNVFNLPEVRRSRNFMYMWDKWNTHYRNTLGANLWAVYNTLTDWGTHVQGKTNNVANIQHTRGVKIQKVLDHHRFGFNKAA